MEMGKTEILIVSLLICSLTGCVIGRYQTDELRIIPLSELEHNNTKPSKLEIKPFPPIP